VSVLCTVSPTLASRPPSGAVPRSSCELDRAYSACLATSERHDRDASDRLLLTRALTHENPLRRVLPNIIEACASSSPRGLGSTVGRLATRVLPLVEPRRVHRQAWTCRCVRPGKRAFHDTRLRFSEPSWHGRSLFGHRTDTSDHTSDLPSPPPIPRLSTRREPSLHSTTV
jgi:hypothetical protein